MSCLAVSRGATGGRPGRLVANCCSSVSMELCNAPPAPQAHMTVNAYATVTASSAAQRSAVRRSAAQCSAVQCSAAQRSAVQCSAVQCSAAQRSAAQCSAVQCSAHSTSLAAGDSIQQPQPPLLAQLCGRADYSMLLPCTTPPCAHAQPQHGPALGGRCVHLHPPEAERCRRARLAACWLGLRAKVCAAGATWAPPPRRWQGQRAPWRC
jgi:hypothetical protein